MKKMIFISACVLMFGCNNEKEDGAKKEEAKAPETKIELPAKMSYQVTPALGNPENIAKVMNFNMDFIAGKMDNIGSYLADSIQVVFADGTDMNTVRDSMVAVMKAWRGSMDSAKQSYISAVALDNKDLNHEWVFQWIDESHFYKGGKKEHVIYHEDYRLEKGKIRQVYQYGQAVPVKK